MNFHDGWIFLIGMSNNGVLKAGSILGKEWLLFVPINILPIIQKELNTFMQTWSFQNIRKSGVASCVGCELFADIPQRRLTYSFVAFIFILCFYLKILKVDCNFTLPFYRTYRMTCLLLKMIFLVP